MSRPLLPPRGFLSYVRKDDDLTGKRISRLCEVLRETLHLRLGQEADIFQDTTQIRHGAVWEKRTIEAIEAASFFIPVVTPAYLSSTWCAKELREFQKRERALVDAHPVLARSSLIFPIHLIDMDDTDPDEQGLFDELAQRQLFDFRDLLYADYDAPAVRGKVTGFVGDIRTVLRTRLDSPPAPPPPAPPPPPVPPVKPSRAPRPSPPATPTPAPETWQDVDLPPETGPGAENARIARIGVWVSLGLLVMLVLIVLIASTGGRRSYPQNNSSMYESTVAENAADYEKSPGYGYGPNAADAATDAASAAANVTNSAAPPYYGTNMSTNAM